MATLPKQTLTQRMDLVVHKSLPRPHLGASIIGHPCVRYLVYTFNWAYENEINGKSYRIFRMGDDIEKRIIEALESIGIKITNTQTTVSNGHTGGSIDGIATNVPDYPDDRFLFEAKSMNHTNFIDVQKKGVQESKPQHYAQMQKYMGELSMDFGLYAVLNKNTAEIYTEMVPYDDSIYRSLLERELDILNAQNINEFPRISNLPSWYQCKFCDAKNVCHYRSVPHKNCRTCLNVSMGEHGKWECTLRGEILTVSQQQVGCSEYTLNEGMWE